jgi:hypothetical protein
MGNSINGGHGQAGEDLSGCREATSSVSDARLHHFEQIKARLEPLSEVRDDMHIGLDTDRSLDESLDYVLECLQTEEALKR